MAGSMGWQTGRATASARKGDREFMVSAAGMQSDGDHRFVWPADLNGGTSATVLGTDGERAGHLHATHSSRPGPPIGQRGRAAAVKGAQRLV